MMIQHSYIKPRSQFGKQCIFTREVNIAVEDIYPEPELLQKYIIRSKKHCYTQTPQQFAAHEAQTEIRKTKNSGMLHLEGGWPREINPSDTEATHRYCRRIERDDQWVTTLQNLMPPMEHYVLQNSAVNIYENFFDDLVPTPLRMEYSMRIRNAYEDPQENARPIRQLSWSPNASNRLAAAYWFGEFEAHPVDASPYSYVWDIENPNKAMATLRSSSPLMALQFNPRDPSLLISGLMSGQVCSWDIRTSDEPVQISLLSVSHRFPATQALWISSKANTEFFSSGIDGKVLWWDTRFLNKPTDSLVMDLDDPARADISNAVGVTALQFEPTISSRFLAGTEQGGVINVNRKTNSATEKLMARFECHAGSVVAVERNPAFTKHFLTIGDCSAKVWSDDTREGCLFRTRDKNADLSGGCWSQSRSSIFYAINTEGTLDAYDILTGMQAPLTSIHVSGKSLTAISSHAEGEYIAVGGQNGTIYVVECSEGLTTFSRDDKAFLSSYLESCNRYEKMVDNRVKEIRLLHGPEHDEPPPRKSISTPGSKKGSGKDRKTTVAKNKEQKDSSKKSKRRKSKRKASLIVDVDITAAEQNYFLAIETQQAKFEKIDPADEEAAQELLKARTVMPPVVEEDVESQKSETKLERKSSRGKRMTRRAKQQKIQVQQADTKPVEKEPSLEIDPELMKKRYQKKRATKILHKTCQIVCKPEICCKDMEEKRRAKIEEKLKRMPKDMDVVDKKKSVIVEERWYRRLTEYVNEIPDRSPIFKKKMLILKDLPPSVLREELKEAKKEIRTWQEQVIAKKLSSRTVISKLDVTQPEKEAEPEEEEIKTETTPDTKAEKRGRPVSKRGTKKSPGKSKKIKLTTEDIEKQEEEQRVQELWKLLKQKVKEHEPPPRVTYPRISAAQPRKTSEDITDFTPK